MNITNNFYIAKINGECSFLILIFSIWPYWSLTFFSFFDSFPSFQSHSFYGLSLTFWILSFLCRLSLLLLFKYSGFPIHCLLHRLSCLISMTFMTIEVNESQIHVCKPEVYISNTCKVFFFNWGESGTRNWNFAKLLSQIFTISETLSYLTQKPNIIQHFPQFFNLLFQSTLSLKKLLHVFLPAHHLYHYYGSGGNHKSTRVSKEPPDQSLSIFISYI